MTALASGRLSLTDHALRQILRAKAYYPKFSLSAFLPNPGERYQQQQLLDLRVHEA